MSKESQLRIAILLPDLLGTYGDRGNAVVLERRAAWRGVPGEIINVVASDGGIPDSCDVYLLGGGEDVAQLAAVRAMQASPGMQRAVERGAAVLAVCAGFQVVGRRFKLGDGSEHDGLGLLDVYTEPGSERAIGEIVTATSEPHGIGMLSGFENHLGRTTLDPGATPLAQVVRGIGNGAAELEGAINGNVIGTYMHGPVLARNSVLADWILQRVLGADLSPMADFPELTELRSSRIPAIQ